MYGELNGYLSTFNSTLNALPPSGFPTVYGANLSSANANGGPQITNSGYLQGVLTELQEIQATGVKAIMMQVGFPVLYRPFYPTGQSGQTQYNAVVSFYQQVAAAVRAAGMKLIVENDILLSSDAQAGWTNTTTFYGGLTWAQYTAARAQNASTLASTMQPDYLVLAEEPDSEATQTGQSNLNNPTDAASMVSQEIAAVRALNLPNTKIGAGFGSWISNLLGSGGYLDSYLALNVSPNNLDYLDFHVYPINTEGGTSFLANALTIANTANQAGLPVGMSEAWMWKMENSEWLVLSPDDYRGRNPFSFWAPLDAAFLQTIENLAQHTQMLYQAPEGPYYLFAYQTYGGTASNGGAANCTCTTSSCTNAQIMNDEVSLTAAANQQSNYTTTAFGYNSFLVAPPDRVVPSTPTNVTGSAGYTVASVTWTAATDNVGVAGYNVIRDGKWIANSVETTFNDTGLSAATTYQYQIQAFDIAGNTSPSSATLSLTTADNIPPTSPTNLVATPVSPQEIDLSWSPAQDTSGLSSYQVLRGTSAANLIQVATRGGTSTSYKDLPLTASTTYFYGVKAVDKSGNVSPLSNIASAVTLALPSPPTNLVATSTSGKQIKLTWTAATGGLPIVSYQVLQGTAPGLLQKVATAKTTSYTSNSLVASTTYYYEVQAVDSVNDVSNPSSMAWATTLPNPNAPTHVTATASSATKISLTWTETLPPRGLPIANYKVLCGTSPTSLSQVATTTGTSYNYTSLVPQTSYFCAIEAVDTASDVSIMSAIVSATTAPLPNPPQSLAGVAVSASKISVTWAETVPTGGLPIANYKIWCGTSPTNLSQVATALNTSYTYTGLVPSTTYFCAVEAVDTGNDVSAMSATVSTTTAAMPNPPANVVATANSSTKVTVTWTETIPRGGLPISNYKVFRGTSPTNLSQLGTRTTASYTDTAVSPSTTYYYAVEASDTGGDVSAMSAVAPVSTPN